MSGFGALLRRRRVGQRMTQETLAERAGVTARSIREMERDRRNPRIRTVERLAEALGLSGEQLAEFLAAGTALSWSARVPEADGATAGRAGPAPRPVDPEPAALRQLPADLPDFVGRGDELRTLRDALRGGFRLATISGPAGMGKTALAVHLGHQLAPWFPHGQLYVALGGAGAAAEPAEVLGHLLRSVGADPNAVPAGAAARAALLRAVLADRRLLLVLDDAGGHGQVLPLLPGNGSAVLVTGRLPLTGLPGATNVDLPPLAPAESVRLLASIAGRQRIAADPAAAGELARACGGLPLAVRILGARLAARPQWAACALVGRLVDERHRLDELSHGDLAVRPRLHDAHRTLSPPAARAFALLGGLPPVSFPEWTFTVLLDLDRPAGAALLQELLDARLVDHAGIDRAGQPRYRLHEVVRLYARERHDAEVPGPDWRAALVRLADGWMLLAGTARERLRSPVVAAGTPAGCAERPSMMVAREPAGWFAAERESLAETVRLLRAAGLDSAAGKLDEDRTRLSRLLT